MPQMRHPSKGKLCGTVQRPHPASCIHEELRTALQGLANLLFPPLIFPRFGIWLDLLINVCKRNRRLAGFQHCRNHIPPGSAVHIADILLYRLRYQDRIHQGRILLDNQ